MTILAVIRDLPNKCLEEKREIINKACYLLEALGNLILLHTHGIRWD